MSTANEPEERDWYSSLPDTYSRRKRRQHGQADPLTYDNIPDKVRIQALHILEDAVEEHRARSKEARNEIYRALVDFLRRELGLRRLASGSQPWQELTEWFLAVESLEDSLDAIEQIFRQLVRIRSSALSQVRRTKVEGLIRELNARLLEASVGYQFEAGRLFEMSSHYLHAEVVVPALTLLAAPQFAAANKEFLDAHTAFRDGDYEKCLIECCKALESVIKVIASARNWTVDENAPARKLVSAVFENQLIPQFLESEFTGIRTVLENGIGTMRNKSGGHGAGQVPRVVPRHLAAFQLHQTGAAITLLAEAHLAS